MLFNSIQFVVFFPVVVIIYFLVPPRMRELWLLLASYFFYMCWNAKYLLLLLFSTAITYFCAIAIETVKEGKHPHFSGSGRGAVVVAVLFNLAILFYFKYVNFMLEVLKGLLAIVNIEMQITMLDILLPVGVSFYIFQALGYTMDVYWGKIHAEKNFLRYALFVSFFPQLVAGPIERSENLLGQFKHPNQFNYDNVRSGLLVMMWGFFLKLVIADRCAVLVNTVYGNYEAYYGFQLVTAHVLFAIQVYCDFMGYSTIAVGAARVLGFHLMENFAQPYFSISIKDFWRRWHISLSSWFRDYLYIPLGGSRCGRFSHYLNIIITFLVSGLWHGAGLTYVVWGGLHGIYQVLEDLFSPLWKRIQEKFEIDITLFSWKALAVLKTFVLVDFAWIFFRAETITKALEIIGRTMQLENIGLILNDGLLQLGLGGRDIMFLMVGVCALFVVSWMREKGDPMEWLSRQNIIFRYMLYWGCVLMILFSLDLKGQEFIYFQF